MLWQFFQESCHTKRQRPLQDFLNSYYCLKKVSNFSVHFCFLSRLSIPGWTLHYSNQFVIWPPMHLVYDYILVNLSSFPQIPLNHLNPSQYFIYNIEYFVFNQWMFYLSFHLIPQSLSMVPSCPSVLPSFNLYLNSLIFSCFALPLIHSSIQPYVHLLVYR